MNRVLLSLTIPLLAFMATGCVTLNCPLPAHLKEHIIQEKISSSSDIPDVKRNSWNMGDLCADRLSFYDHGQKWELTLVRNTKHPAGPFWYLPHDNEDSAFEAAVYAAQKYGGGFLAVEAGGKRYASGTDPNRNFKNGSVYTRNIFAILDTFKVPSMPYLALHSNKNGHEKYGGEGTVSMKISSAHTHSCPAGALGQGGLNDEDNLVYLAGRKIDSRKIGALNTQGVNVKYEVVNGKRNDFSMSNYIALHRNRTGYVNIEAEDGDVRTQKKMIDKVMKLVYQGVL